MSASKASKTLDIIRPKKIHKIRVVKSKSILPVNNKLVPVVKSAVPVKLSKIKKSFNDRHPFVVPLTTLIFLFITSVVGFLIFGGQTVKPTDSRIVQYSIDGKSQFVPTRATTVKEFLDRTNVHLDQADLVEPSLDTQIISEKFSINIYRAKLTTLIDDSGKRTVTKTADTLPVVIAKKAGYTVYPEDKLDVISPNDSIKEGILGTQIKLDRSLPVKLNLYGTAYDIRTRADTVADLAKERNISFDNMSILPDPSTKIQANQIIFVTEPGKQLSSSQESIPRTIENVDDPNLELGKTTVKNEGSDGVKAIIYEVLPNSQKKILNEVVLVNPVNKVVAKGKKAPTLAPNVSVSADKASIMAAAGISPSDYSAVDFIVSKESGWRPGAGNASSGAYGLCQALPANKMASAGGDYLTNPITQLSWCNSYANRTYGGWQGAYSFWSSRHWW